MFGPHNNKPEISKNMKDPKQYSLAPMSTVAAKKKQEVYPFRSHCEVTTILITRGRISL